MTASTALCGYLDWPGAAQVIRVERERVKGGQRSTETAWFVTSLSRERACARDLHGMIRGHWATIENGLHWVRDVTLGEDRCTIFRGHSPRNLAALRNAVLTWLREDGAVNFAASLRKFSWNSQRLFTKLGYQN